MSSLTNTERESKLNMMKIMILNAEKKNLNTRERKAEDMAKYIVQIIKNVHNRKDI